MRRREFITLLGGAAVAWPPAAGAQQPPTYLVGFVHSASPGPFATALKAFRQGLSQVGYLEGQNVVVEYRWAEGQYDRLSALAADLVAHHVLGIVAVAGNAPAQAAKAATIFVSGGDPVSGGLVASLSHPGGNVTGDKLDCDCTAFKTTRIATWLNTSDRAVFGSFIPRGLG